MNTDQEWHGPRRVWERNRGGRKHEQGVVTPKRPKSRRQRAAAKRIDDKAQTASRTEESVAWLKQQMGLQ